jgi:broad specificity phosphatase PhoE
MTTRLYLIRHGATPLTAEDRFSGETNVTLSEDGVRQVEFLARRLSIQKLAAIYASPLDRTMETARIIAAPDQIDVIPEAGLKEISHGRWEGKSRAEVEKEFAEEYSRWETDPFTFAPDGGETGLSVTARALPVIMKLVAAHEGERVAVISHKATIRLLISSLLGFDARRFRDRLDQSPAALNVIDFKNAVQPRLVLFNDTSHYDRDSIPDVPKNRLSKVWDES